MIQSMTGFGKAEYVFADHKTIVEIRAVNSKQLDLTLKVNALFRDKEPEIRSLISPILERGKVDVAIYTTAVSRDAMHSVSPSEQPLNGIDWNIYQAYLDEYARRYGEVPAEVRATILRMPDVIKPANTEVVLSDEEAELLNKAIHEALDGLVSFRKQEGAALEAMFTEKLDGIAALLPEVEPYEKSRVENIKQHLLKNLDKLAEETKQKIDMNRLEAELIYYLEKLDITEEKVRLTNHIKYFREVMANGERTKGEGKQLGFVAQEMGREINTLGSKSNQSEMQIIVVKMKDILEQIKEQVLNVL